MPSSLFTPPICFLPSHSASHHEVVQKNLRATNARRAPSPRSLANHDRLTHVNGKDWLLRQLARTKRGNKVRWVTDLLAARPGHRQPPDAAPAQRWPLRLWQHQIESECRRAALARGGPGRGRRLRRVGAVTRRRIGTPDVVIHQLTDLPKDLNPREMGAAIVRTARIRSEGTRNLVRAAIAAGAHRLVAQSIAWAYAPGAEPHAETDPLDTGAEGETVSTCRD